MILLLAQLAAAGSGAYDAGHLRYLAHEAGLDPRVVLSVAAHESGNTLNPRLRGASGEWGRFQILPRTAARRCPGLNVHTYRGNTICFIQMFQQDVERHGIIFALHQQNHSLAYGERVLAGALGDL